MYVCIYGTQMSVLEVYTIQFLGFKNPYAGLGYYSGVSCGSNPLIAVITWLVDIFPYSLLISNNVSNLFKLVTVECDLLYFINASFEDANYRQLVKSILTFNSNTIPV